MIRITRRGKSVTNKKQRAHHYSVGGRRVVFDASVTALHAFSEGLATERYSDMLSRLPSPVELDASTANLRFHGMAPLDGSLRDIRCWSQGSSFQIDVETKPICRIDLLNNHIQLDSEHDYDRRLNLEVVTGPALMLALASKGIYSLHGGAVSTERGVIGFVAESGVGKSTLSAHAGPEWRQLCDDIMPLVRTQDGGKLSFYLQDFPQLKLEDNVPSVRPSGRAQLNVLIRLKATATEQIEFQRLHKRDAMLQIVRHTVAAKLFNHTMMRDHARFAKRLSTAVPMIEVSYPRDLAQLPELRHSIIDHVSSMPDE